MVTGAAVLVLLCVAFAIVAFVVLVSPVMERWWHRLTDDWEDGVNVRESDPW